MNMKHQWVVLLSFTVASYVFSDNQIEQLSEISSQGTQEVIVSSEPQDQPQLQPVEQPVE
jgi:hypothetical protein